MLIRIGPFSTEAILKMAALAKDYHPAQVLPRLAREAGHRGLVLHPAWISGCADATIRVAEPNRRVSALTIRYDNPAFQTDTLTLEVNLAEEREQGAVKVLSFEIFNRRRQRVASGTAEVRA